MKKTKHFLPEAEWRLVIHSLNALKAKQTNVFWWGDFNEIRNF